MKTSGSAIPSKFRLVIDANVGTRRDGAVASHKTKKSQYEVSGNYFNILHNKVGMRVQNPENWGERHIAPVVRYWYVTKGVDPKTLETYLSRLRCLAEWVGKPGMVKHASYYLPEIDREALRVSTAAKASKSWVENGIDMVAKLAEAAALDWRLGSMLSLELAFGLRRKEALHCRPWVADRGEFLSVFPGEAKNGRPRLIPIETEVQRQVLDKVKLLVGKRERLAWPTKKNGEPATLEYWESRYNKLMARLGLTLRDCGVTGHGLRSQFAENTALLHGIITKTLDGKKGHSPDRDAYNAARFYLSQALGHNRETIVSAYGGSHGRGSGTLPPDHFKVTMDAAFQLLHDRYGNGLPVPPAEVLDDCGKLMAVAMRNGSKISFEMAYALWSVHSLRYGTEWIKPSTGIEQCLEAAALALFRIEKKQ